MLTMLLLNILVRQMRYALYMSLGVEKGASYLVAPLSSGERAGIGHRRLQGFPACSVQCSTKHILFVMISAGIIPNRPLFACILETSSLSPTA